jgi:uncharacterized protein
VIVFVDAGGWISVLMTGDQYHESGKQYFEALTVRRAALITTDFVLAEVITRLRYDGSHRKAAEFIALYREAESRGSLTIFPITAEIWKEAEAIFLRYDDAVLSFTDCMSFAFLERHTVDEVFGYDSHYEMMGHILRPKP